MPLSLRASEEILSGAYANNGSVTAHKTEVYLDFFHLPFGSETASMVSRIMMSPAAAKEFCQTLMATLVAYEQAYGKLPDTNEAYTMDEPAKN